jgi:hypothetical protein
MPLTMNQLAERLFGILGHRDFLAMKGLANEVPIFIQTYAPSDEDAMRRTIDHLLARLRSQGVAVGAVDLFDLVLAELEHDNILDDFLQGEARFRRRARLETLINYSDPQTRLIPRLVANIAAAGSELTLITGSGRVYPFLRTHTILESLQPAMLRHPIVIFFPGEYTQDLDGGSHLRLFGSIPAPVINNPYYRATNLDRYTI